jgi:multidrug efflux system outer membrane protein
MPVPDRYVRADATMTNAPSDAEFWQAFGDTRLSRLIDEALVANHDLRIALARLDGARALARESRFNLAPIVTASASASDTRASSAQRVPGAPRDVESYDAGVDASWEVDLFGRVRRGVQARSGEADAAAADLAAVQVAVAAELATAYFEREGLRRQLVAVRANAQNQRGTLDLVQARNDAGRGTELDTAQASAQLASTLARIPPLESAIAIAAHRIEVLTGRQPGALATQLDDMAASVLPDEIAVGTPGELLRRRPDIAAAERRLAAATARIGVATADLFPRFTLGALLGVEATTGSALFDDGNDTRRVMLGIDWSFLDVGRVRARIAAADADAAASLATYERTVVLALEETENALVRHERAREELAHWQDAADASAHATTLARLRYDGGLVDFLQVLDAERSQLDAEDRLAQSRTRTVTSLVAIYKALAGGWPARVPESRAVASTEVTRGNR